MLPKTGRPGLGQQLLRVTHTLPQGHHSEGRWGNATMSHHARTWRRGLAGSWRLHWWSQGRPTSWQTGWSTAAGAAAAPAAAARPSGPPPPPSGRPARPLHQQLLHQGLRPHGSWKTAENKMGSRSSTSVCWHDVLGSPRICTMGAQACPMLHHEPAINCAMQPLKRVAMRSVDTLRRWVLAWRTQVTPGHPRGAGGGAPCGAVAANLQAAHHRVGLCPGCTRAGR